VPGGSTTNSSQQQQSTTNPYGPTQGQLQGILNTIGGVSTAPTAAQTQGANELVANAENAPNFAPAATNVVNTLLSGGGANNFAGILNNSYGQLQSELNPYASGANIGKNDALQPELDTIGNDTQNSVQGQFAAAGRSFSPAEAQAIARGTAQGEAPVEAAQYNQDVANQLGAATGLNTAAGNTASGLSNLNQTLLGNMTTGLSAATAIPGILNQNANNLIAAGGVQQALPYSGVTNLESLLLPIAGLGAQSSGSGTGTTTQETSPISNILGGILGGTALLGGNGLGLLGSGGSLTGLLKSDRPTKKDIRRVGILNDDQPVYKFRYKGDPSNTMHIGLLAQDVEKHMPDAVVEIGGVKHVNYDRATKRAAA
jgi:Chaperone of endosialidase